MLQAVEAQQAAPRGQAELVRLAEPEEVGWGGAAEAQQCWSYEHLGSPRAAVPPEVNKRLHNRLTSAKKMLMSAKKMQLVVTKRKQAALKGTSHWTKLQLKDKH